MLNENYNPDLSTLIDDYLDANATRNRPLDLLPLFLHLDGDSFRARLPEEQISPRPAFHYRLPNSMIDDPNWSISQEWAAWMKVERLAADVDELDRRCRYEWTRLQGPVSHWLRRLWRTKPMLTRRPLIAVTGPDKGGFPAWVCTALAVRRAGGYPLRLTPKNVSLRSLPAAVRRPDPRRRRRYRSHRYKEELESLFEHEEEPNLERSFARRILSRIVAPFLFLWRGLFSLTSHVVDKDRDASEFAQKALRENLPVLGICRGAQFLNIHLGGTLHEEASGFYGEVGKSWSVLPRTSVELEPDSYLRFLLGADQLRVNSLHKQAVKELGRGLRVVAHDGVGITQAIELSDRPGVLGVQWHPEYLPVSRTQQRLFHALVQEAFSRKR